MDLMKHILRLNAPFYKTWISLNILICGVLKTFDRKKEHRVRSFSWLDQTQTKYIGKIKLFDVLWRG